MRKRILHPCAIVVTLSILISLIGGYAWLVRAAFTSAITVNVVYPPSGSGGNTVGGTSVQQVFRTGGPPSTAPFAGLDPGNPNPANRCPAGSTLTFLSSAGIMGPIGPNDFVYALQVSYDAGSTVRLDFVSNGTCPGRKITSIGYCVVPSLENQNVAGGQFTPTQVILLSTGVDFVFDDLSGSGGANHTIPPGRNTAVLFFTSPDPPSIQATSIQSSGVASNGTRPGSPPGVILPPIYGPCPASIDIDKKIGCSPNGPFTDGPLTALAGAQLYYQITVKNTGKVPLASLMVSDPQLGGDLTSQFNFPDIEVASGTTMKGLAPMGTPPDPITMVDPTMRIIVVPFTAPSGPPLPGTQVTVVNTATAKGEYFIPKQDGTLNSGSDPAGPAQSVTIGPDQDSVTLNVVAPAILCDKKVNGVSLLTLPQNAVFPLTLNYTLKATNTGTTDLAVSIDDPKIKALKTTPPAGVTISMTIQGGGGFSAGSLTGGTNLPASFATVAPGSMAQVNISVMLASKTAFAALADPGNPITASNIMTAAGTVTNFTGCTTNGVTAVDCFSDAAVIFPDCSITLTKAVACDTGTGINPPPSAGSFSSTLTSLVNAGLVFRYIVTNTGLDTLDNVTITDNKITSPSFAVGTLTAGETRTIYVAATAAATPGSVTNTANVTASCHFAGGTATAGPVTATVNTVAPNIACDKKVSVPALSLGPASTITLPTNPAFPLTLNYTLKATNTGTTDLAVVIDDLKLKALKSAPPAGVTVSVTIQSGAGFATGTLAGGANLPATFATAPPNGMAQVNVAVTLASESAFTALADASNTITATNTMTASGTVANFTGCTTNATVVSCSSNASVVFPLCRIALAKAVACDTGTGVNPPPPDASFGTSVTALISAGVVFHYVVTNTGVDILDNVTITDDKLTSPSFSAGTLNPGQSKSIYVAATAPGTVGSVTNTANVTASCRFVGGSIGAGPVTATVNTVAPAIACDKKVSVPALSLGPASTITLPTNPAFPLTLNYTLKATNTGTTSLSVVIDDLKLKALKSAPPAGVTINVTIQGGAGFAAGTLAGGSNLQASFATVAPGSMAQVNVAVTLASENAFAALADASNTITATNTMTATGTVTSFTGCTTNATVVSCSSNASVIFPLCRIALAKAVACDTGTGVNPPPPDANFGPSVTALVSAGVVFRYVVTNTGLDVLDNVTITDDKLTSPSFSAGTLNPGQSKSIYVAATAPGTVVSLTNTANVTAGCHFAGGATSAGPVTATVTTVAPAIACDKKVNGASLFTIPSNPTFPLTLNYTLKATNTGTTSLAIVIDDPKLKALKTAPPSGVTVSMAIQGGSGFAAGTLAGGTNLQATFATVPPAGMAQVNVTVTLASAAAFVGIADSGNPIQSSNTMTAVGTVTGFTGCTTNATTVSCSSDAAVRFPLCTISLTKAVACDTGTGISPPPPDASFGPSVTALVSAGVVFRYVVTNTGLDVLDNVTITDDKITSPLFNVGTLNPVGLLNPGESKTIYVAATAPGTVGSVINTANVTASCHFAGGTTSAGPVTATVTTVAPNIACDKKVSAPALSLGPASTVTLPISPPPAFPLTLNYTLKASNTGTTSLAVSIDDPKLKLLKTTPPAGVTISMTIQGGGGFSAGSLTGGTNLPASFTTVAPGSMAQVNVTLTLASAAAFAAIADSGNPLQSNNTMSATGTVTSFTGCTTNATTVSCSSSAAVNFPLCTISLTKAVACDTGTGINPPPPGGSFGPALTSLVNAGLVFRYVVTNTGLDTLDSVTITDNKLSSPSFSVGTLNPGASSTIYVTATAAATPGSVTNTANVTASCHFAGGTTSAGPVTATVTTVAPSIVCEKKVSAPDLSLGPASTITLPTSPAFPLTLNYTLKATNTGTTDLAVVIDDLKLKALKTTPPAGVTVSVTIQSGAGFATGTLAGGNNLQASFPAVAPQGMAQVNVAVTLASESAFTALADASNTITATNTMTASGTVANFTGCTTNATVVSCSSNASVVFPLCRITLAKAVACDTGTGINPPPPGGSFGPSVTALISAGVVFRYVVTNTGLDVLDNVTITDNKITSPLFSAGTLTPGQSKTIYVPGTAPGTVGSVINTANVTASCHFAGGTTSAGPVTATVNAVAPAITCDKRVNGVDPFTIQDNAVYPVALNYTLKMTNTGTTDLSVVIDDPKLKALKTSPPAGVTISLAIQGGAGFSSGSLTGGTNLPASFATVPPGSMAQVNVTVTLPTASAFAGIADSGNPLKSTNTMTTTATVTNFNGCTSGANLVRECSDSAEVNFIPPCSMSLTKAVACGTISQPGSFGPSATVLRGTSVVYRFVVTNTGLDVISNVAINDNMLAGSPFSIGTLNPGQSVTKDVAATAPNVAGAKVNTATANGTCVIGNHVVASNQATATVNVLDPQVSCDKTVNGIKDVADYKFGTTLTYTLTARNNSVPPTNTNLDLMLSDPILSALPGVSCKRDDTNAPVTLPFTFTNVPPGVSKSITCTVSFVNEGAFKNVTGGSTTLTNTLTVKGTLTDGSICTTGANPAPPYFCTSQASVSIAEAPIVCIVRECVGAACRGNDPGALPDPNAIVSDDKEGSVLFYNFYSSNIANPAAENTRIDLTNTAQGTVFVHLFFVDGSSCAIADSFVCLSGNQTTTLLASDMDPGVRGYVVAVAVDPNGCPIRWNFLIGDEYVKLASGQQANLGAEAFAAISPDPTGCTQATSEATLRFDGVSYNLAPRVLALDNFASNLDGNQTLLVINRVGGDLSSTAATIGGLFGILFDDLEKPFSFQFSAGCQFFGMLSGSFPRTTPRVDTVISAGRSGWLKFWATADEGLLGAALVFNRGAGTTSSAYNQGHNLHKLRLTAAAQLTMPVFPPGVP